MAKGDVIPCRLLPEVRERVERYAAELEKSAFRIGSHGLSEAEFQSSGLFRGAIERLRGIQAASMDEKKRFCADILAYLERNAFIKGWAFAGGDERHDYEVKLQSGRTCIIETKGGLDGNNTNIFERPPQADEFLIWSLNQNPTSDPAHNVWSGLHTRLSAELIHRKQVIDGVAVWDMLCGTAGRPCPKIVAAPGRAVKVSGRAVPPPCLYLMPKNIPDPRNNPTPVCRTIREVEFFAAVVEAFGVRAPEIAEVRVSAQMDGANLQRKTQIVRDGQEVAASGWTTIKRASR